MTPSWRAVCASKYAVSSLQLPSVVFVAWLGGGRGSSGSVLLDLTAQGCVRCRVEFRTQEDDADPSASEEGKKLVAAAQAFFQLFSARMLPNLMRL